MSSNVSTTPSRYRLAHARLLERLTERVVRLQVEALVAKIERRVETMVMDLTNDEEN